MNNNFLSTVSQFVKLAIDNSDALEAKVLELKKQAAIKDLDKEKYRYAIEKAADTLYDTDFFTSEEDKRTFLKKAAEDPIFVVRTLEKVCNAADVAQIGKPARVAARPKEAEEYDPVMAAAFGYNKSSSIIDD